MSRTTTARLAALALTATVAFAACGDDDGAVTAAGCDAYTELQAAFLGDPAGAASAAERLRAEVEDGLTDEVDVVRAAVADMETDPSAFESAEFASASEAVGDAVFETCDVADAVDVSAIDYGFDELPAEVEAGRLALRLRNDSEASEPHELLVVSGLEGQSADELAELPMEQLFEQARPVAVAFADQPGTSATTLVDLEPGSYLVICTLPVGGEHAGTDGPPTDSHADHGMVTTLTVA